VVLSRDMLAGALENADVAGTPLEAECRARTHIIHVWSDDRMIEPKAKEESSEAKRLGVVDRFVVQYSGNHGRFHDIETLLEIARLLREESGIVFQFIGEGQKKSLVSKFKQQHRLENVFESSYCAKELLGESLAMSDLGVVAQMPGQERVCYPSKLLGIMAAGRPAFAICVPTCEMARMIEEHSLGFVIQNGDAGRGAELIRQAARDTTAVAAMGCNARQYLQDHLHPPQRRRALLRSHQRNRGNRQNQQAMKKWIRRRVP
jgi:glycosyltransferase involved in cell wall biosynthesis